MKRFLFILPFVFLLFGCGSIQQPEQNSIEALMRDQSRAMAMIQELKISASSGIDHEKNLVYLEVGNPNLLLIELDHAGLSLPSSVEIRAIDPENLSDTLRRDHDSYIGPNGESIFFPKQSPTNFYMQAGYDGRLILDESGCLRLEAAPGALGSIVLWHHDFSLKVIDSDVFVLNGNGQVVAQAGEPFRAGGGWVGTVAEPCIGEAFVLGEVEPIEDQAIPYIYIQSISGENSGSVGIFMQETRRPIEIDVLEGVLTLSESGCLMVGDFMLVWPQEFFAQELDSAISIIDFDFYEEESETVAQVGDYLILEGNERKANDYVNYNNGTSCQGPFWGVSRVVSSSSQ